MDLEPLDLFGGNWAMGVGGGGGGGGGGPAPAQPTPPATGTHSISHFLIGLTTPLSLNDRAQLFDNFLTVAHFYALALSIGW